MTCVPKLLHTNARLRVIGRALPAELLPYAAALLLPLLLLPPERACARWTSRTSRPRPPPTRCHTSFRGRWCALRFPQHRAQRSS